MMSGTIYYFTKYGATEDYSRWLSADTGFELRDIRKNPKIGAEAVAVIGSNLRMGKVGAAGWIRKKWPDLKEKKVVFFSVGASKIGTPDREDIITRSLPKEIIDGMKVFHLPGRIDHKRLGFFMSGMMKRFAKYEKDEVEKRRAIEGYDDVKRELLAPMVAHIKSL
jgi:menaquinone-dependent protoporphyrinogen IX oxidase